MRRIADAVMLRPTRLVPTLSVVTRLQGRLDEAFGPPRSVGFGLPRPLPLEESPSGALFFLERTTRKELPFILHRLFNAVFRRPAGPRTTWARSVSLARAAAVCSTWPTTGRSRPAAVLEGLRRQVGPAQRSALLQRRLAVPRPAAFHARRAVRHRGRRTDPIARIAGVSAATRA